MDIEKAIANELGAMHVMYPKYGRTADDIPLLARMFDHDLRSFDLDEAAIKAAFAHHRQTSDKFPTVADIAKLFATGTAYRFDNGPDGFGALYSADHPYTRWQQRIGTPIGEYAVTVQAKEMRLLDRHAANAPAILLGEDAAPSISPRSGGFKQIGRGDLPSA